MKTYYITPGCLSLICFFILSSLQSQVSWRFLTKDNGLSSNIVHDIIQTKAGNILILTDKGIDKYDGLFSPFSVAVGTVRGFSSVYELANGNLVVKRLTISPGADLKQTTKTGIFFFDGKELKEIDQLSSIQIDDLLISSNSRLLSNKFIFEFPNSALPELSTKPSNSLAIN